MLTNEGAGDPVKMCSLTQHNLCNSYTQSKCVDEDTGQILEFYLRCISMSD